MYLPNAGPLYGELSLSNLCERFLPLLRTIYLALHFSLSCNMFQAFNLSSKDKIFESCF